MSNCSHIFLKYSFFIILLTLVSLFIDCASSVRYTRPSYREQSKSKIRTGNEKRVRGKKQRSLKSIIVKRKLKRVVASYLGVKYRYGGTSRRGMDCSGFVWRVFQDLGKKDFPRTSSAKLTKLGKPVLKRNARPGDLIFFRNHKKIDHVGIYMGNKVFVHSSRGKGVVYTSVYNNYFRKRYVCIRRVL